MSATKLGQGDLEELKRLSDLSGANIGDLTRFSLRTVTRATRSLGGQVFPNKVIKIQTQYICPMCVANKLNHYECYDVAPDVFWYLDFIRTCPKHGLLLVPLREQETGWFPYDFAARLARAKTTKGELSDMVVTAPTKIDEHSINAFSGVHNQSWLANFDAFAVSHISERLGCAIHGVRSTKHLDRINLAKLADVGFKVLSQGADALKIVLADLTRERDCISPRTVFGVFFNIMDGELGQEVAPVRKVFRDHILDNFLVNPGDVLLGEPCVTRRFHSIQTAAAMTGMHPVKITNVLRSAGHITNVDGKKVILIEAEPARDLLEKLSSSIFTKDALKYLGLPWRYLVRIQDAGLISPTNPACGGMYLYSLHELKSLRNKMCQNGRKISQKQRGLVPIYKAANQSVCGIAEVVKLLVSGDLKNVGLIDGVHSFDAIRVDPTEVFDALPSYQDVTGALTREELRNHFGVCTATIAFLLREGHFDEFRARCKTSRKVRSYVTVASVERFTRKYVSFRNLATARQISGKKLQSELKGRGLYELPVPERCRGRFFKRADVLGVYQNSNL